MNRRPANPVLILPALVTRRVIATASGSVTNAFVYDGYLQIADSDGNACVWDPTEPVATRPLARVRDGSAHFFTHDGNKNVSELADGSGTVAAHYEYAPFGEVTFSSGDLAAANPFRFSSEYADDTLGLVYYNYRHYDPVNGRWLCQEIESIFSDNAYAYLNNGIISTDRLGLYDVKVHYYLVYGLLYELTGDKDYALEVAKGSQYPDTRQWDAMGSWWTLTPVRELIWTNDERLQYRELLHNLNSLRCCQIEEFRTCLSEALEKEEDIFSKGIYLHVLADTFAHVDPRDNCSYGTEYGHLRDLTHPDDVQWVYNGEEVGKERLEGLVNMIKKTMGNHQATPGMDALIKKLYTRNYLFSESIAWWYFYGPSEIVEYARKMHLPENVNPNKPFKNLVEEKTKYIDADKKVKRIIEKIKDCLEPLRE